MVRQATFSKIAVIQSLQGNEFHTGNKLHEDLETMGVFHQQPFPCELHNVSTNQDLCALITQMEGSVRSTGYVPILHIETHGGCDKKGLVLSSGDYVSWADLKDPLTALNIATCNNLLVVMSACHGRHLAEIIQPIDRSPCWGIVGPEGTVTAGALLRSFSAFYDEIFATGDGSKALKRLNAELSKDKLSYNFVNSEWLFKYTYKKYILEMCNSKALEERARRMYKEVKKRGTTPLRSVGSLKRQLRRTQETSFEQYRSNFFMYDLCPDNKRLFQVNYEDVLT